MKPSHVQFDRDVDIEGDIFSLIATTHHDGARATTAFHSSAFARSIGGARFVRKGSVNEAAKLARAMTDKCLAAGIPADGQKTVISCESSVLASPEQKVKILADHIDVVRRRRPGAIFGPDIANPEANMDQIANIPALRDHVTGLSRKERGLSIDERGYTALGLAEAIRIRMAGSPGRLTSASIQGFGAVGSHLGLELARLGLRVVAISNELGAVVSNSGLDVTALHRARLDGGDQAVIEAGARMENVEVFDDPAQLFAVPAHILCPAARTSVLAGADELSYIKAEENRDALGVEQVFAATRMALVVEGANHPLTPAAESFLEHRGVGILPDYIVNCGGLIGCWVEWDARHNGPACDLDKMDREAKARIRATIAANLAIMSGYGSSARLAAAEVVRRAAPRGSGPAKKSVAQSTPLSSAS